MMNERITVAWLHDIKPAEWVGSHRGISYANWAIHLIQTRPVNQPPPWDGYDAGPFVWSVMPTHGENMIPLERPGAWYTILVLESREDVLKLLALLERNPLLACEHGVREGDWCEACNREYKRAAKENET